VKTRQRRALNMATPFGGGRYSALSGRSILRGFPRVGSNFLPLGTPILNGLKRDVVVAQPSGSKWAPARDPPTFMPVIARVLCPPPLTGPIFMGDNEIGLSTIGILIHEDHENDLGNVRDFVSEG